jgi:type IV pilus assembly protein PilC
VLRHYLGAGLTLRDVFRQQAARGPAAVRPVAARLSAAAEQGTGVEEALTELGDAFPPLFVSLAGVGEQTGMLPEIFEQLEHYYSRQQKLRRDFISRITYPVLQLVGGVIVVALMILILGLIAEGRGGKPLDPLGLGLAGPRGAMIFLLGVGAVVGALFAGYLVITRVLGRKSQFDEYLLRIPVLGPALEALALTRFCLALRLTMETGMPIANALTLSFKATGNDAFEARLPGVLTGVRKGTDLPLILQRAKIFPHDFLQILEVAEETGNWPEVLKRQANHYDEEAGRRLAALAVAAGWGVWLIVSGLMIWTIFRIFMTYLSMLQV